MDPIVLGAVAAVLGHDDEPVVGDDAQLGDPIALVPFLFDLVLGKILRIDVGLGLVGELR